MSSRRHNADSSSYAYNSANTSSSSSGARPHHRLPTRYQTSCSSSHRYTPAGYQDDFYTSSSSSHVTPPPGYRDFYTASSSSHRAPAAGFRDDSTASSTSHQSPLSAYRNYTTSSSSTRTHRRRYEVVSTSSMRQTYQQPIISDYSEDPYYNYPHRRPVSPVSTVSSNSTKRGALTPGNARERILSIRLRLRKAQTAVEYANLYEDAQILRERLRNVECQATMSVHNGVTPIDDLKE